MRKTLLILALLILSLLYPLRVYAQEKVYTLAVVPQFPPSEVFERWSPFIERVSKELGITIKLLTYKSIPEFEEAFLRGEPDFAFMNPYHAVMAKRAQGYLPLIRDTKPLTGILVVKKDSPYKSVKDLDGKVIAFPAPNAFGASLYMRALLSEHFKIKFTPLYVKTHNNVYRYVILGKAHAGGGVNNTFMREPEEVRAQLRILYETPGAAPHPLCAHPRVPKELREKLVEVVLKLGEDEKNFEMLNKIQIPKPVRADYNRDYKPLEKLNLEKYVVRGEP